MSQDELTARLRRLFADELDERARALAEAGAALARGEEDAPRTVLRVTHAVKGAARAAAAPAVAQVCHELESRLLAARAGAPPSADAPLVVAVAAALEGAAAKLRADEPLDAWQAGAAALFASGRDAGTSPAAHGGAAADSRGAGPLGSARVPVERLDGLTSASAELMARTLRLAEIDGELAAAVADLEERAQGPARPTALDLHRLAARLRGARARAGLVIKDNVAAARRVQREVRGVRMRPFADACTGLERLVPGELTLRIAGTDVELDGGVIQALREPLAQLVGNAAAHAFEPAAERLRLGKPERGSIAVAARAVGESVAVTVEDDGHGLDRAALRREIERRGLAGRYRDGAIEDAIFEPGLTTASEVSEGAGRGLGLEVVRRAIGDLRGTVHVESQEGRGTRFTLQVPVALGAQLVAVARAGGETVGFPASQVERFVAVADGELERADGRATLRAGDERLPVVELGDVLGLGPGPRVPFARNRRPAVIVRAGRAAALLVDELAGVEELVLAPLPGALRDARFATGAAVGGGGRVVLLLAVPAVVAAAHEHEAPRAPAEAAPRRRPTILLVEDSVTTRTLERFILENHGYEVLTAAHGAEAWRLLGQRVPDLVLTDVEMPELDGVELTRLIRGSEALGELPVVLLTARDAPEERERGMEAGASAYLVKQEFDQAMLLETLDRLVGGEP